MSISKKGITVNKIGTSIKHLRNYNRKTGNGVYVMDMKNIILIGMPGAGKSTIGVILAKVLGFHFIDTDIVIQEQEKCLLKDIIESKGLEGFLKIENQVNCDIITEGSVIATGGSVIYGSQAMDHLREIGTVIYIKLSYETLKKRLGNIRQRGVVLKKGQNLKSLYEERCPLYEKYAHIIVDSEGLGTEELMEKIVCVLDELPDKK
ncbi:hypothetical protein GCM10023142_06540 [Anaerocolumna aminovalerica]|nr:shikimate kinase [Anaerocolumna aminovalerica]